MDFQMLFISSFLKQLVKNGKQMKKTTFCIFDVSVVQSEKNSCPAMYWPETPVQGLLQKNLVERGWGVFCFQYFIKHFC